MIPSCEGDALFYFRETDMKGRIFFGIIVVIVGALLLLMALEVISLGIGDLFDFIPSIFILWGLYLLVVNKFKRASGPIVMIAIAAAVQLLMLGVLKWVYVLPIVIILIGIAIIAGGAGYHGRRKRKREHRRQREQRSSISDAGANADDYLNVSVKMSEVNERNRSKDFQGGEISCVMGTVKLDLTEAEIIERPARIHADIVMGGLDIVVPDRWSVHNDIEITMGDLNDNTVTQQGAGTDDESADVVLSGSIVMGHVTVESASSD